MIKLTLNSGEGITSTAGLFGVSEERMDELTSKMATSLTASLDDKTIANNYQLMKRVIEDSSPETVEELAFVMFPLNASMETFKGLLKLRAFKTALKKMV